MANQHCLMAELAVLSRQLRGESGDSSEPQRLAQARAAMPAPSALDTLCAMFGLSEFERRIVLLAAGGELDGQFAARCAAAPGANGKPWPSLGLALATFPDPHWDALSNARPLRHWRLIEPVGSDALVTNGLRIDERILFFLTGVSHLDERLVGLVRPVRLEAELSASQIEVLLRLTNTWQAARQSGNAPLPIQLCGVDPGAKRALATRLAGHLNIRLFSLSAAGLPANLGELEMLQRLWEREAILQNAALLVQCDRLDNSDGAREFAIDHWIEHSRMPLLISTREPRRNLERAILTAEINKPTSGEQRMAWQASLGPSAESLNGQVERVISQFDFSSDAIRIAVGRLHGEELSTNDFKTALWDACRLHARPKLAELAQRIQSSATWSDIILPAPQMQVLQTIAMHARQRAKVLDRWGFARQSNRGLGLSALFSGPSGTGKTLAAEILANEMQLDLFRIDLSAIVSKYLGETEKNLRRVFDAAEEGGAVLLFDEADALFGKRSEVKDSHDRYANVEISYLLQRMEAYRGLAILTTNMKEALDRAFLRRLRFVVQFPFPDQESRAEIWRRIFPTATPTDQLDIEVLSRLSISGGNIRSIGLNAAFAAADADEPVRMPHLLRAARLEYEKLEKPLTEAELGGWR